VLLAAVASITTACTAAPSQRPAIVVNDGPLEQPAPSAAGPAQLPVPPLEEPTRPSVAWTDCDEVIKTRMNTYGVPVQPVQCARVQTILDSPSLPGRSPTAGAPAVWSVMPYQPAERVALVRTDVMRPVNVFHAVVSQGLGGIIA
jgi:hypothetical protein